MKTLALILIVAVALAIGTHQGTQAGGNTYVANSLSDTPTGNCTTAPGGCTLRDALADANENPGHDTITFDPAIFTDVNPGIALNSPLLVYDPEGTTIDGTGANVVIVPAGGGDNSGGLLVYSLPGYPLKHTVIREMTIGFFSGPGISMCAGASKGLVTCTGEAENIVVEDVVLALNDSALVAQADLFIRGESVQDVRIQRIEQSSPRKTSVGVRINAGSASRVELLDSELAGSAIVNALSSDISELSFAGNNSVSWFIISAMGEIADSLIEDNSVVAEGNHTTFAYYVSAQALRSVRLINNTAIGAGAGILTAADEDLSGLVLEENLTSGGDTGPGITVRGQLGDVPNLVRRNIVNTMTSGIIIETAGGGSDIRVAISRNSTFNNTGLGIDLAGDGVTPNGSGPDGPNSFLDFPVITGADAAAVSGTACPGCLVELFISDDHPSGHGAGSQYLAYGIAGQDGQWNIPICGPMLFAGQKVTTTATDLENLQTSEYSANLTLDIAAEQQECPDPLSVPWGDTDCDGNIAIGDALKTARYLLGLSVSQAEGCPPIESPFLLDFALYAWGDVDCDGSVAIGDALKIARQLLGLSVAQTDPCPAMSETVTLN